MGRPVTIGDYQAFSAGASLTSAIFRFFLEPYLWEENTDRFQSAVLSSQHPVAAEFEIFLAGDFCLSPAMEMAAPLRFIFTVDNRFRLVKRL
jgi:hypothetical protein